MNKMLFPIQLIACAICLGFITAGCEAGDHSSRGKFGGDLAQTDNVATRNHAFAGVEIAYRSAGCSFEFSPIDFCDETHVEFIEAAIRDKTSNFNRHFILLAIPEWPEYHQQSIVAIDTRDGVVYPVPIDAYSGRLGSDGNPTGEGKLSYGLSSNEVCVEGAVLAYRALDEGRFCFRLERDRFVGHRTPYMD